MELEFEIDSTDYDPSDIAGVIAEAISDPDIRDDVLAGTDLEVSLWNGTFISARYLEK